MWQRSALNLGLADNIEDAPSYDSTAGLGGGNNLSATHQPGEPNHAGKSGSSSVWLVWHADAKGIASFSTRGSSFDTLLAVYTNTAVGDPVSVTNLAEVASDDDRGGYLTSALQFNAAAGQDYFIAIDGFLGASGNILLGWQLDATNAELPQIIQQPADLVVGIGDTATFSVIATSSQPLTYQWYVDGILLPNATNSNLTISNVQLTNAGNYFVTINNGDTAIQSQAAFLQINTTAPDGSAQQVAAVDKLGDVANLAGQSKMRQSAAQTVAPKKTADAPPGFTAQGFSGMQVFSTANSSRAGYFKLLAAADGTMLITTEGSGFDTICTVYAGPPDAMSMNQLTKGGLGRQRRLRPSDKPADFCRPIKPGLLRDRGRRKRSVTNRALELGFGISAGHSDFGAGAAPHLRPAGRATRRCSASECAMVLR